MFHGRTPRKPRGYQNQFSSECVSHKVMHGALFSGLYLSVNPPRMFVYRLYKLMLTVCFISYVVGGSTLLGADTVVMV